MEILSKESCAKIDKEAIEKINMPSIILMENAGEKISREIINESNEFVIVAGVGNNGGDGLVIARKLILKNKQVHIFVVGNLNEATKDFKINLKILRNMGSKIQRITNTYEICNLGNHIRKDTIVIDSIFGIGLNRNIEGIYKDTIEKINKSEKIISIDIPSGIDANTGETLGTSVKAYKTYTIECLKLAFIKTNGIENAGEIKVISIDIPNNIKEKNSEKIYVLPKEVYINKIPKRNKLSHKGDFGKVGIVGGSKNYIGAVYIVSEASIKTGSGLVTIIADKEISTILKSKIIEAMVDEYDSTYEISGLDRFDVIACGPGMGTSEKAKDVFSKVIKDTTGSLVIDADGLNILSENKEFYENIRGRAVLTPHLGEMSRLTGISIEELEKNKVEISRRFAKENDIILLLKGYNTLITDGTEVFINKTGSSKMASGGMGDCLTGIITSLIGQGLNRKDAAILGAYIHGYAGDMLGKEMYSVSAREIIKILPKTIEDLLCEN